jgi:hypothetical protein
VPEPEWLNRAINIDTGCVFGGKLTALRDPEVDLVAVAARQTHHLRTGCRDRKKRAGQSPGPRSPDASEPSG